MDWYHTNGRNQSATAKHFDKVYPNLRIKQPLVSAWVKEEAKWRDEWSNDSGTNGARTAKRARQTIHPEVTDMLDLWVSTAMEDNILITGEVLCQKWTKFADLAGVPKDDRLKLSEGWLSRYKVRAQLKEYKRHGEAASVSLETAEMERQRVQELVAAYGVEPRDLFNADETGLFYGQVSFLLHGSAGSHADSIGRMPPDRGLSIKKCSGVKGTKVRLTYLLVSNADGSEKLPPLIIGKAKKPRAFENKTGTQLGFYYRNNAKAWMTGDIYQEWLRQWDFELGAKRRKVVLLQDNFSGHIIPDGLQNIRVENLKPNLTAYVQPMDQGIIRCFKAHYRAMFIQRAIRRYDAEVTPSEIYDINQLQAMRLADNAWREVDTTTIRHCWRKAGILPATGPSESALGPPTIPITSLLHPPSSDPDPIVAIEDELRSTLDDLEDTGLLQRKHRMDIEALLNPPEESQMVEATTDEEICRAVLATYKLQEGGLISSGDDNVEEDAPVEPCPTYREVLQAVSIINRYVDHVDNPVACKLEGVLGRFTQFLQLERSKALTTTQITDYFHIT